MSEISKVLGSHYSDAFKKHGANPKGVDWRDEKTANLRYEKMLAVNEYLSSPFSLLDVGCGYGGLLEYIKKRGYETSYHGIDIVPEMLEAALSKFPIEDFKCVDILDMESKEAFDYVVCNGILTQKLDVSILDMDKFLKKVIKRMFMLCKKGMAFNLMSTYVNFFAPNLYYKHPLETLSFCLAELTQKVKIDHSYGLYEYTIYLYK